MTNFSPSALARAKNAGGTAVLTVTEWPEYIKQLAPEGLFVRVEGGKDPDLLTGTGTLRRVSNEVLKELVVPLSGYSFPSINRIAIFNELSNIASRMLKTQKSP